MSVVSTGADLSELTHVPARQGEMMKRIIRPVLLGVMFLMAASSARAQQAVILVRHAERADQSKDSALSVAGRARARALAALLADTGVNAIYASQYQRTVKTAEPLALSLKIPVQTMPAAETKALLARLRSQHKSDVVLVVGHSDTVPELLHLLGDPAVEPIEDDDFGNVFVVVPKGDGPPVVVRMRY